MFKVFLLVALATVVAGHVEWKRLVCDNKGHFVPDPSLDVELKKCGDGECVFNCQVKLIGWDDEDGRFSFPIFLDYVKAISPPQYERLTNARANNCYAEFGRLIDPADPHCVQSKEFSDCIWSVLPLLTCDPEAE